MKKILLLMLLVLAVALNGCDNQQNNKQNGTDPTVKQTQTTESVDANAAKEVEVKVYRAAADGSEYLLPEKVTIKQNGKTEPELALEALVSTKPQDAKYDDVVPIGTKVLGLKIENGIAYANFSKELEKKNMGSYGEMMLCYAITNTLTEFEEIKKVQILIEGEKVVTITGHMDIEDPLSRNTSLLK